MVEKIIVNPNEIRGYGNILEVHSSTDYDLSDCTIESGTDTVNGASATVYTLTPTASHSYSLSFSSSSYTASGGSAEVSVTLTDSSVAVSGATISFTGGSSTVTATTNSSGVATATVSFTSSGTCTATYGNTTATASITVQTYLFYDDCSSSSGLDNYASSSIPLRNNGTNSLAYDSTEQAYLLSCTKANSESCREITALTGYTDSFKVTIVSKVPNVSTPAPTGLVMYFDDSNWYAIKEGSDRVWTGQKVNGTFSESSKPNHNLQGHTLVTVITVDNTNHTMNIKTYENDTLINYTDYTINTTTATSSVKYGLDNSYGSSDKVHIYEIIAEAIV